MPNHVSHKVWVETEFEDNGKHYTEASMTDLDKIQALMQTGKGDKDQHFDFNVLVHYPEPFKALDDAAHKIDDEFEAAGGFKQDTPEDIARVEAYHKARFGKKDGYNSGGYEWCIAHWGTKWNAYEVVYDYGHLYLQTAWSTPVPIWEALSNHFPDMKIVVEYADEDTGSNCGILHFKGGELVFSMTDSRKTSSMQLPAPELFARAIKAEQRESWAKHEQIETRKELELLKDRYLKLQTELEINTNLLNAYQKAGPVVLSKLES